jgi:putative ABC transport system permease protein
MLRLKWLREFGRQRALNAAVVVVTALGVSLFVSSYNGYLNLRESYADTQHKLALADLHLGVENLTAEDIRKIQTLSGVERVENRIETSLITHLGSGVDFEGRRGMVDAELRVLSLPSVGAPALDRLHLLEGALPSPSEPDGVVIESHFAQHHHLAPGAQIEIAGRPMRVSGVAVSAEYLWVTRNAEDLMPSPAEFGVAWMREPALSETIRSAGASGTEHLLVALSPSADASAIQTELAHTLGPKLISQQSAGQLPGIRLLQLDVDGLKQMALFFPLLFLVVGALVVASILGRLVDAQRSIIGTLLALGMPRRWVLLHYLSFGVALGVVGALLGITLGEIGSRELTSEYAQELSIPFVTTRLHLLVDLVGLGVSLVAAALAGLLPARRAASVSPVEAMRAAPPALGRSMRVIAGPKTGLPLSLRLAIRNLLASPTRSLASAAGVAAAVVLLLSTASVMDGMTHSIDVQFHQAQHFDLQAELAQPVPEADLQKRTRALAGVSRAEVGLTVPAKLRCGSKTADVLVEAVESDSTLLTTLDEHGRVSEIPHGAIALPHGVAHKLGCRSGSHLVLDAAPWATTQEVTVAFESDSALGSTARARLDDLQSWLQLPGAVNLALLSVEPSNREAVRRSLFNLPGVARVHDATAMRSQLDQVIGLSYAMIGAMLLFGSVLAAAIIFNTSTLSILERMREFATLRAIGQPMSRIRAQISFGNGALAALGLAAGLPAAVWTAHAAASSMDSDLFSVQAVLTPHSLAAAVFEVVLVLLIGQWPGLRAVAHANLAEVVRSREG